MKLAIIAAGRGLRLKEEGVILPKPLVNIKGTPLIKRIIEISLRNGVDSIVCIINQESVELKKYLIKNYSSPSFNLIEKSTLSSLHSLYHINKFLSFPFLLTTTDSIFLESEFKSFINYGLNLKDADGVIALTSFVDDEKPLFACIDQNNRIINFKDSKDGCEFVTGGMYLFKKNIREEINEAVYTGVVRLRNFLRFLIQKDFRLYAFHFSKIIDVDHIKDIKTAEEFLSAQNFNAKEK